MKKNSRNEKFRIQNSTIINFLIQYPPILFTPIDTSITKYTINPSKKVSYMSSKITTRIRTLSSNDLSTTELQTNLNTIHAQSPLSDSDSLLLCSILFNKIIPQTYILLDNSTKRVIYQLCTSRVLLSQLFRILKSSYKDVKSTYYFIDILLNIIKFNLSQIITETFNSKGKILDTWMSILTIKILDSLGSISIWLLDNPNPPSPLTFDRENVNQIMESFPINATFLIFDHLQKEPSQDSHETICQLLNTFIQKEPKTLFRLLLDHWETCLNLYSTLKSSTSKQKHLMQEIQKKFLLGIFHSMNESIIENTTYNNILPWFHFLHHLLNHVHLTNIEISIYSLCEYNNNIIVSYLWINILRKPTSSNTLDLLYKFGNKDFILNTSIPKQISYTKFLILILKRLNNDEIITISSHPIFLNAITTRLESKATITRELGMFVADYIYNQTSGKNMFTISSYNDKRNEFMTVFNKMDFEISNQLDSPNVDSNISDIKHYLEMDKQIDIKVVSATKIEKTPIMVDIAYNSDDDDSDLDDSSVGRKPNIAKPVFLKDLLYYFTSDPQKDNTSFDKRGVAFSIGIEMVRIKKGTPELNFYSTKLMDAALDLENIGFPVKQNDNIDEDQEKIAFDSWKLSFMIAICVGDPERIFRYLLEGFLKQDWNISTRIQVLTCIGLSCRELCGETDDFIWGKTNLEKAATKKLSGPGHLLFSNLDRNNNKIIDIDREKKEDKLVQALESAHIGKGIVTRKSRKLQLDNQHVKNDEFKKQKSIQTTFINKKLPKLYFTMVSIWQEINSHTFGMGFRVGSLSEYLNGHFIEILSMIYSCGVPMCIELIDMTIEHLRVLAGQLRVIQIQNSGEFPVLLFKAITNGLNSVLNNNERTFSILGTSIIVEMRALLESYSQFVAECPMAEESTRVMSFSVLNNLRKLC